MNIASINVAVTDLIDLVSVSSVYFLHADRACWAAEGSDLSLVARAYAALLVFGRNSKCLQPKYAFSISGKLIYNYVQGNYDKMSISNKI